MRNSCTDKVYRMNKRLHEEEENIHDRINDFYANKTDLFKEIEKEKQEDPSKELLEIEEDAKDLDPFRGFLGFPRKKDSETIRSDIVDTKICKFHSKGFCKKDFSCRYFHAKLDCNEHIESGKCLIKECTSRHREDCKFFRSSQGCGRGNTCAFLHRQKVLEKEDCTGDTIDLSKDEEIKHLENSISLMKQEICDKDLDIDQKRKNLESMTAQIKEKNIEISEKDAIIKRLQDELDYSTEESDDENNADEDDSDVRTNANQNAGLTIGSGRFGKEFEVRPGMEDEAKALREEWKQKQKRK